MAQMFVNLAQSCVECQSKTIRCHDVMTNADADLIEKCNSTSKIYKKTSIVEFQNAYPDDVALVFHSPCVQEASFKEFQTAILNVSSFLLHKECLQRQERVGL